MINHSNLVDEKNQTLWEKLSSKLAINIEESTDICSYCNITNDVVTIGILPTDATPETFTHELLHLESYLYDKHITGALTRTVGQSQTLIRIFTKNLIDHISNVLEHIKMYEAYIALGYNPEHFSQDYHTHKLNPEEQYQLKIHYPKKGPLIPEAVDTFIGKGFAILGDPNPELNYTKEISFLQNLDTDLYSIISFALKNWSLIRLYEEENIMDYKLYDWMADFYDSLKPWITKNRNRIT